MSVATFKQQDADPVRGLVSALEQLLERAKTGELRGMCVAVVPRGKEVEIHERFEPGDAATAHKLVAGTAYLQVQLVTGLMSGARPLPPRDGQ